MNSATGRHALVVAAFLGLAASAASSAAPGQSDCDSQEEAGRARCVQQKRVAKECAGRAGEALAACRKVVLESMAEKRDCNRLPEGYGRNKCEDENLRAEIEARCGSTSGDAYQRCYAEVMAKAVGK
jgi:hypothetical protein